MILGYTESLIVCSERGIEYRMDTSLVSVLPTTTAIAVADACRHVAVSALFYQSQSYLFSALSIPLLTCSLTSASNCIPRMNLVKSVVTELSQTSVMCLA